MNSLKFLHQNYLTQFCDYLIHYTRKQQNSPPPPIKAILEFIDRSATWQRLQTKLYRRKMRARVWSAHSLQILFALHSAPLVEPHFFACAKFEERVLVYSSFFLAENIVRKCASRLFTNARRRLYGMCYQNKHYLSKKGYSIREWACQLPRSTGNHLSCNSIAISYKASTQANNKLISSSSILHNSISASTA